ncbi:MAG: ABC transporter substrate-binding protein [Gammaproteobacteria bacterium]|nr:ABC transporter substrate-binding protein [Gammaproteobacteria bacterium]
MRSAMRHLGVLLLLSICVSHVHAIEVVDDSGKTLHLVKPATRVITLAPNLTELMFDLGVADRIVATVQFSDYPVAAKQIPRIGSSSSLNLEALLAHHPDLVLAWESGNNPQQLHAIERLGIPVYRNQPHRLQDISSTLIKLGQMFGVEKRAETLAHGMDARIAQLRHEYAQRKPITGFYQIWDEPIYTVNGQHIISDVMDLCGVRNVFADAPILAPVVTLEAVLARNPQMIISGGSAKIRAQNLSMWRAWPQLTAVRAGNLFYIDADLMQRTTPRILEGANILCRQAQQARLNLQAR